MPEPGRRRRVANVVSLRRRVELLERDENSLDVHLRCVPSGVGESFEQSVHV